MKNLHSVIKTNHNSLSSAYAYKGAKSNQNRFASLSPKETLVLSEEKSKTHYYYSSYPYRSYASSGYTSLSTYRQDLSDSSEEDHTPPVLQGRKVSQVHPSKAPSTPSRTNNVPKIPHLKLGDFITHQYPELLTNNKNAQDNSETETSTSDEGSSSDYDDAENLFAIYA